MKKRKINQNQKNFETSTLTERGPTQVILAPNLRNSAPRYEKPFNTAKARGFGTAPGLKQIY